MDDAFPDRARKPTPASLAKVLGRTKRHGDLVLEQTHADHAGLLDTWMHYGSSGWVLKGAGRKRAPLWLAPREGRFIAPLALREEAVRALRGTRLPAALRAEIASAKAWPEGRPARVRVTNLDHARWVRTLVGLKLAEQAVPREEGDRRRAPAAGSEGRHAARAFDRMPAGGADGASGRLDRRAATG